MSHRYSTLVTYQEFSFVITSQTEITHFILVSSNIIVIIAFWNSEFLLLYREHFLTRYSLSDGSKLNSAKGTKVCLKCPRFQTIKAELVLTVRWVNCLFYLLHAYHTNWFLTKFLLNRLKYILFFY